MDELIPALIVLAVSVISSISSARKKAQKNREAARANPADALREERLRQIEQAQAKARAKAEAERKAAQTPAPAQAITAPAQPIAEPMQPTVHPHVAPDCDTHDAPGSLGVASAEGKDPCHEQQMATRTAIPAAVEEESALALDWNGANLVKAFVMQEVLTRPCQRRRAR